MNFEICSTCSQLIFIAQNGLEVLALQYLYSNNTQIGDLKLLKKGSKTAAGLVLGPNEDVCDDCNKLITNASSAEGVDLSKNENFDQGQVMQMLERDQIKKQLKKRGVEFSQRERTNTLKQKLDSSENTEPEAKLVNDSDIEDAKQEFFDLSLEHGDQECMKILQAFNVSKFSELNGDNIDEFREMVAKRMVK